MTSAVEIANLALTNVGTRSTITDLTEASPEADICNKWFDTTRQQLLRMALWGFARKFLNLSLIKSAPGTPTNPNAPTSQAWNSNYPPPPWLFEYAYPTDCLMARYIVPASTQQISGVPIFATNNPTPWQTMGPPVKSIVILDTDANSQRFKAICTNQDMATLCYTADVTEVDLWDQGFQQAMIDGLAAMIAIGLTGDKKLAAMLAQRANATVTQARVMNANEALAQQDILPDWIRTRGIAYGWDGYTQMMESFGPLFAAPI